MYGEAAVAEILELESLLAPDEFHDAPHAAVLLAPLLGRFNESCGIEDNIRP